MRPFWTAVGLWIMMMFACWFTVTLMLQRGPICVPINDDHQRCLVTEDRLLH